MRLTIPAPFCRLSAHLSHFRRGRTFLSGNQTQQKAFRPRHNLKSASKCQRRGSTDGVSSAQRDSNEIPCGRSLRTRGCSLLRHAATPISQYEPVGGISFLPEEPGLHRTASPRKCNGVIQQYNRGPASHSVPSLWTRRSTFLHVTNYLLTYLKALTHSAGPSIKKNRTLLERPPVTLEHKKSCLFHLPFSASLL